jgi:hypothetical protein
MFLVHVAKQKGDFQLRLIEDAGRGEFFGEGNEIVMGTTLVNTISLFLNETHTHVSG